MTDYSYFRGHLVVWKEDKVIGEAMYYADTNTRAGFGHEVRPCKKCGKCFAGSDAGQPDPCLGILPGVDNACCGHGVRSEAYIRFNNGLIVRGFKIDAKSQSKS